MTSLVDDYIIPCLDELKSLLYPRICCSCSVLEPLRDHIFCFDCLSETSLTDMHLKIENDMTRHFWGRVPLEFGASMFLLDREHRVKNMIHEIKYRNQKGIAQDLGVWYGRRLLESALFPSVDLIVPVPLHSKRMHDRGYNQSDYWAEGLSQSLAVSVNKSYLSRRKNTRTQTKMDRTQRQFNMENAFTLEKSNKINPCHVLLVDDVMTTGSTLEACIQVLQEAGHKTSVVTIAIGQM